jgi:type VI secretion system protein ImpH
MAPESRLENARLDDAELAAQLTTDPAAFEFFQAVRLLERLFPERRPVGGFGDPGAEVVHFSARPAIAFPPSAVHSVDLPGSRPARMVVNFMGLIGPLGVLPHHYTLFVAETARARSRALRDFLDIFQHRLISLFYRAWRKYHFTATYERGGRDGVTEHLRDLIGLGITAFRDRFRIPDEALLFYAGALAPQPRSAVALEQLLEDYFQVPVEIEQFVGGWYALSGGTLCSLGADAGPADQVGLGAVVGDEIWDQQARVRIRLGPLRREQYERFLPTGADFEALRTLTRFFSHDQFDFEVQLVLARGDVPGCELGADDGRAAPLGWSTWMRTRPFARDADDAVLTLS